MEPPQFFPVAFATILFLDVHDASIQTTGTSDFMGDKMKNLFIVGFALGIIGFTGIADAKSKSKSSKTTSKQGNNTSAKPSHDTAAKQKSGTTDDKQSHNAKHTKMHRCKLPNGKIDTGKNQEQCLKANGKWVKY